MTRLNFAVFVLWTVVSVAFCQDDEPVVEVVQVVDKDVVRGVVEVCLTKPRHQKRALLFIKTRNKPPYLFWTALKLTENVLKISATCSLLKNSNRIIMLWMTPSYFNSWQCVSLRYLSHFWHYPTLAPPGGLTLHIEKLLKVYSGQKNEWIVLAVDRRSSAKPSIFTRGRSAIYPWLINYYR